MLGKVRKQTDGNKVISSVFSSNWLQRRMKDEKKEKLQKHLPEISDVVTLVSSWICEDKVSKSNISIHNWIYWQFLTAFSSL